MIRYETLFLTSPEITQDEASKIEKQFNTVVEELKGQVISYERWGKFKLSYPIKKFEYGVYFLVRFEVAPENAKQLLENIKIYFQVKQPDLVMRFISKSLEDVASLEYKRPESLEEAPVRDVDTFLKENKMTGLLGKNSRAKRPYPNSNPEKSSESVSSSESTEKVESNPSISSI